MTRQPPVSSNGAEPTSGPGQPRGRAAPAPTLRATEDREAPEPPQETLPGEPERSAEQALMDTYNG